jgi:hypothetical protein
MIPFDYLAVSVSDLELKYFVISNRNAPAQICSFPLLTTFHCLTPPPLHLIVPNANASLIPLKKETQRNEIGILCFDRGRYPVERIMIRDREINVCVCNSCLPSHFSERRRYTRLSFLEVMYLRY